MFALENNLYIFFSIHRLGADMVQTIKEVLTGSCSSYGYPNEHIFNAGVVAGNELLKVEQTGPAAVEIDQITCRSNAITVRVVYSGDCLMSEFFHPSFYLFSPF